MCWIDYCGVKECRGYELVPDATLKAADALAKAAMQASPYYGGPKDYIAALDDALAEYRKARGTAPNYGEPGKPMSPHMGDKA